MHRSRSLLIFLLFSTFLSASDLTVSVTDPQGAAVVNAEVALEDIRTGRTDVRFTSSQGTAWFSGLEGGAYRVRVRAAGFLPWSEEVSPAAGTPVAVTLKVGAAPSEVTVTASRFPVSGDESGASAGALDASRLEAMQSVAVNEAIRFLPGAVVNTAGRRGGLGSLFVRGGESRYNKVIVDGVPVNEPGGTFDFAVVPLQQVERLEFVRGSLSALYGSDAMSSVVRLWSVAGRTRIPELRFGGDGGNYGTGHGFVSLAGARGAFDYNLFADHFTSDGLETNDAYWNTSQGGNLGWSISPRAALRLRSRHSNNRSGVQSFWNFNGQPLIPPDSDQFARQNNFLASAELVLAMPAGWQHRLTAFEYNHRRANVNPGMEPGRDSPLFGPFDFPFAELAIVNRAGFDYQGDFAPRAWARTTFGYQFEDENGFFDSESFGSVTRVHGLRRNHEWFGQQFFSWNRVTVVGGARFVHNESFGDRVVPRISATFLAWRGRGPWTGTRLRAGYSEGIKAPTMPESFAGGPFILPNPDLEAEETRSFEAGVLQDLLQGRYAFSATYFDNRFRNQVAFSFDPMTFLGQFVNVNRARAHGAEFEFHARPTARWSLDAAYVHTATRILAAPFAFDPLLAAGRPLLRRPRHSGSLLVTYAAPRWGANLGGSFVGRRPDSDFLGFGIEHAAGYARWDAGGWYALHPRVTAFVNVENLFDRDYEEVAGYPALGANVRAGVRFRIGGE